MTFTTPFTDTLQDAFAVPRDDFERDLELAVGSVRRAGVQVQSVFWPGITRVETFSYTCLHGITAGVWTITTAPQDPFDQIPEPFGNLVITDGFRTVVLRSCKADRIDATRSTAEGVTYTVRGLDRRWLWRNQHGGLGGITGRYNQVDTRGKLVPWSIRSPEELFRLCLAELGEENYVLDVPRGVPRAAGANLDRYLRLGEYFAQSNTNPAVTWDRTPPAEAMAALADLLGLRVVYQPYTDRVLILPLGRAFGSRRKVGPSFSLGGSGLPPRPPRPAGFRGVAQDLAGDEPPPVTLFGLPPTPFAPGPSDPAADPSSDEPRLPDYPYEMSAPGIDDPETPQYVGVAGPPIRVQLRMPLEPVGEEWDGSYLPIDQLSYAPSSGAEKPQISVVNFLLSDPTRVQGVQLVVEWPNGSTLLTSSEVPHSAAERVTALAAQGNADPVASRDLTFSAAGNTLTVTGKTPFAFEPTVTTLLTDDTLPGTAAWGVTTTQNYSQGGRSWENCPPPHFMAVRATDRLSHFEARSLAQRSVFKCYRVFDADPSTRKDKLPVPGYGELQRIQQLVVQPTKAEQVVPQPRITSGVGKGDPVTLVTKYTNPDLKTGVLPEFYNGKSRDRRHTVTGSVSRFVGNVFWNLPTRGQSDLNTGVCDRVFVDSDVTTTDRGDSLVVFSDYVYRRGRLGSDATSRTFVEKPELTLETACLVCHPDEDMPLRWTRLKKIEGGTAPTEWHIHEDLQVSVVGEYTDCSGLPAAGTTNSPPPPPPPPAQTTGVVYQGTSTGFVHQVSLTLTWNGNTKTVTTTTGSQTKEFKLDSLYNLLASDAAVAGAFNLSVAGGFLSISAKDPAVVFTVAASTILDPAAPPGDAVSWSTWTVPSKLPTAAGPGPPPARNLPHRLTGWHYGEGDVAHVDRASADYLDAHARKYVPVRTEGRKYVGVWPVNPDGAVQLVTYTMGPEGPSTLASLNDEMSTLVPNAPARRRNELLPPNRAAVLANKAERDYVDSVIPRPGSAVK